MLRSALQLAELQLGRPDSISSQPVVSDISRPCLGSFEAAQAARDVAQKLKGILRACSTGDVPAIVQKLQSIVDQQQLLVTWLESQVPQEAPSCSPSEAILSSCTADAAAARASEGNRSTAVDCTTARSASTAASSANSSLTNSTIKPGSFATHPEVSRVKSLAEGLVGTLKSPTNSVDCPIATQQPKAISAGVAAVSVLM